ncbi:MAG: endonuclease III, partial [Planctomycetota bacterium]|nr:endonuclease III [Planctomycetota bacterium]
RRMGLSENGDPVKLEYDLAEIVPRANWTRFSHLLIHHGRNICKARKPDCENCPLAKHCPAANEQEMW